MENKIITKIFGNIQIFNWNIILFLISIYIIYNIIISILFIRLRYYHDWIKIKEIINN